MVLFSSLIISPGRSVVNRNFDIFDLELFQAVAKAGSLSAAASTTDLPLSTVSRRISNLEDNTQARLFERNTRGLTLTEAGHFLLERCDVLLSEFDYTFTNINQQNTNLSGRVVVHAPPSVFSVLFPDFIAKFREKYPKIELDLYSALSNICFTDERIDVFLHPGVLPDSNVIAKPLYATDLDYFVSPKYIEKYGLPKSPSDTTNHHYVIFTPFTNNPKAWSFHQVNSFTELNPALVADDFYVCMKQVIAGLGIGMLPVEHCQNAVEQGQLVHLFDNQYRHAFPSYIVLASRRYIPQKVKTFVDELSQYARRLEL